MTFIFKFRVSFWPVNCVKESDNMSWTIENIDTRFVANVETFMDLNGKRIVITGAGGGIGKGLALEFKKRGAKALVIGDINGDEANKVASEVYGLAVTVDVSKEEEVKNLVDEAHKVYGGIDLFCSNAGIFGKPGFLKVSKDDWSKAIETNILSHVYAVKYALPSMLEAKEGYFLFTSSAAGLLSQIGAAPYTVTKHATVGFAEWVAITYGERGISASCLCPQAVKTKMTEKGAGVAGVDGMIEVEECAQKVAEGLNKDQFLITPHEKVKGYLKNKAQDYDQWISGMQKLQSRYDDWVKKIENDDSL